MEEWCSAITNKDAMESIMLNKQALDHDWVTLILTARDYGLSVEEIRSFLRETAATSD